MKNDYQLRSSITMTWREKQESEFVHVNTNGGKVFINGKEIHTELNTFFKAPKGFTEVVETIE